MTATQTFSNVRTDIAGFSVTDLAQKFGTPTYIYDASVMQTRVNDLRAFDVIRYAQKACSNLAVLDRMRRWGVMVDAVSAGEVRRALAAGYSGHGDSHPIVFTADIFDREALDLVVEHGIHVNCGSPDMIDQLGQRAPGSNITLRINPGFGHGHSRKTNTGVLRASTEFGSSKLMIACDVPMFMALPSPGCICILVRAPTWNIYRKFAERWNVRFTKWGEP